MDPCDASASDRGNPEYSLASDLPICGRVRDSEVAVASPRVVVVPVEKMDAAELWAAAARVAKVLHGPVELRDAAALPKGLEDPARRQFPALAMIAALRIELPRLAPSKVVGGEGSDPSASPVPGGEAVFVTDVDLFTPSTEAVLAEVAVPQHAAIVSVRRLREAFYRRKADPATQRARLVKEILRVVARLRGLPECGNADCALSATRALADIDHKSEHYCAPCWKRLSSGAIRM